MKEYKVVTVVEGGCGTLFLGSSGLPLQRMEAIMNKYASENWVVKFQFVEKKRMLLFWEREAVHITFERDVR